MKNSQGHNEAGGELGCTSVEVTVSLHLLAHRHHIIISIRTLERPCKKLFISNEEIAHFYSFPHQILDIMTLFSTINLISGPPDAHHPINT